MKVSTTTPDVDSMDLVALRAALADREAALAAREAKLAELEGENARLWRAYEALKLELALIKRRLFVAKAERVDTSALQLEFEELTAKLNRLAGVLPADPEADSDGEEKKKRTKSKPKGRRNLKNADLPEVRVEVADELFEKLVAEGKAERIGSEDSYKLGYERGGFRRIVTARVKYRVIDAQGESQLETAPTPPELIKRCLAAPSTLAHIATSKYCDGLPLYRQEDILHRAGASIDRGTMARWLEELGSAFGATIVEAARKDAFDNAFCIMTDATGFAVQPGRFEDPKEKKRRPCRKGHYFVQIADRDHVFFEFVDRHTTENVKVLFKGFSGYVQADASSVYDALFRPSDPDDPDGSRPCTEVGCWSHLRRYFWEAAFAKERVAREGLLRIQKIFELDATFRKRNPPSKLQQLRHEHIRPLVEEFFAFADTEYEKVKGQRGALRSALGYARRHRQAFSAFLEEGRLRIDNNLSEGELRKVVRIRDAALFAGSDDHAVAAGHILSLIASARLHDLDPEAYLRDIIRLLPFWPRERFLELAPKYWGQTRATLDIEQLETEVGIIDVPDTIPQASAE